MKETDLFTEKELVEKSETISPAGRTMLFVDFISHESLIDNKFKKRLMAALYKTADKTWFFKRVGEDKVVGNAKADFMTFLSSLKFKAS